MIEATVTPAGAGEVVGDSPERRVEILCEHDALHATWSRFAAGREGADLHVHRRHTDLFYVLEGELTVRLGPEGDGVVVPAGTLARVPPLVVHGFRNGSDAEVRYLNLHAPGQGFADFLRALRDGRDLSYDQEPPPADGGRPATEAVVGGHAVRVRGPRPAHGAAGRRRCDPRRRDERRSGCSLGPAGRGRRPRFSLFVLEGEIVLLSGGHELRVETGSWAQVPPGVRHSLSFPGLRSGPLPRAARPDPLAVTGRRLAAGRMR